MKKLAINILLAGTSIVLSLLFFDILLHFTKYKSLYLPPMEPKGYAVHDSAIGYDIAPNFPATTLAFSDGEFPVYSNSLGCFDEPYAGETPYIYFTGDSFTWGWVPRENNWAKFVGDALGIRALTCGVNGYGTRQELVKTARHLAILPAPALIVMGYLGANDPDDDTLFPHYAVADGYRVNIPQKCDTPAIAPFESTATSSCIIQEQSTNLFSRIKVFFSLHSVLYNFAKQNLNLEQRVRRALIAFFPDAWLEKAGIVHFPKTVNLPHDMKSILPDRHTANIIAFKTLAEYRNTKLLIVLIPSKTETRAAKTDPNSPNEQMKAVLKKEKIPYIDLLPIFRENENLPDRQLYWDIDGHWNLAGNAVAGNAVADYILRMI